MTDHDLAFEYALGTLRGGERERFARRLKHDVELRELVQFWQQQLQSLTPDEQVLPSPDVWQRIAAALPAETTRPRQHAPFWWAALAAVLAIITLLWSHSTPVTLNVDYVAVLTDQKGHAQLTALTSIEDNRLRLQWQTVTPTAGQSLQLWARSQRDGEWRSLAVFDQHLRDELLLDQAAKRLIQDASELWLTEEEPGGSAIDSPSESVLARGACIRVEAG